MKYKIGANLNLGFLKSHLLTVRGADDFSSAAYGRLHKRGTGPQFLKNASLFKLLFETLQGLVDRFVLFNVND